MVHDYLVNNIEYDSGITNFTAYSALFEGTTVCQGYSLLYYKLLTEAGVQCRFITGSANGEDHGWNLVKIGDAWYNVDVTWDDTANTNRYFNLSQPLFSCDHTAAPMYWEMTDEQILGDSENFGQWFNTFIPNCDGEKYLGVQV